MRARGARASSRSRRRDVAVTVRQRVHDVLEQVALVVDARQADFRHLARGHSVIFRAKSEKLARRLAPMVQHAQVLLAFDALLHVRLRYAFCFTHWPVGRAMSVIGRWTVVDKF